jgi:transcriptional regulator with XRE-family HTH domain
VVANREYILELMQKKKWSKSQLARKAGVSKTSVCRWLAGERGAGRSMIQGLIQAFPQEPLDKLFFLNSTLPNGDE